MRVRNLRDVGAVVRDARRRQQLTQQVVAERAGVQRYQVANLERGKGNPSFGSVLSVCAAVAIELDARPAGLHDVDLRARTLVAPVNLDDVFARVRA